LAAQGRARGAGRVRYGPSAYEAWIGLLQRGGELKHKDRLDLFGCSWWCYSSLLDARRAAVAFLHEHATQREGSARQALQRAADLYQQVLDTLKSTAFAGQDFFLSPHADKALERWTPDVRQREISCLRNATELDEAAVAEIEKGLSALGSPCE
jgi:hypothetical protein